MRYRWIKFKQRCGLAWMILTGHDALVVQRDKSGVICYHYYSSGDQVFYELADELSHHGIDWYVEWLKNNAVEK